MKIKQHKVFRVFYGEKGKRKVLLTENLISGKRHFDEDLIKSDGKEYRVWDPRRSKLACAILKGSTNIGFREGDTVLYLGSSHGYTVSFVSDIVGKDGFVFAVDVAGRVMRDLIFICEERENISPILADANKPERFVDRVSLVDIVYQDIAQKNQVGIFMKNIGMFLKSGGYALLAVKARSVDVTQNPKNIFDKVRAELEKFITIVDYRILDPFQKDHALFVCKKR